MNRPYAFDAIASTYDETFTSVSIAALMRQAVWRRADLAFEASGFVLEMNCGTGEDAVHLGERGIHVFATDISQEMVRVATAKAAARNVSAFVDVAQLAWADLDTLPEAAFDGVLSDFGGLNCVPDLPAAAAALARRLRPGSPVLLCVMGPVAVWEWLWFGIQLKPCKAMRRLRRNPQWRGIPLRYPSPSALSRAFSGGFRVKRLSAIGLLTPPCLESMASRWPRLINVLDRCERLLETLPPLAWISDHYLLELERL
ncbi:MAG: class I SAM-dependent methyltransferase [Bryobacteraceae bacterium]